MYESSAFMSKTFVTTDVCGATGFWVTVIRKSAPPPLHSNYFGMFELTRLWFNRPLTHRDSNVLNTF